MDADHLLIKQLRNGYRMEKPDYAPNIIGEIMFNCWKSEPNERPTFSQLEEMLGNQLESSVSSYYLDLNAPYAKLNEETLNAEANDYFGLSKLLDDKAKSDKNSGYQQCRLVQTAKELTDHIKR